MGLAPESLGGRASHPLNAFDILMPRKNMTTCRLCSQYSEVTRDSDYVKSCDGDFSDYDWGWKRKALILTVEKKYNCGTMESL